ncbi:hypothetical protein [Microlunatus aurantiacus]|uniref:hypothetical protein n=1 Tax=Microlunatus aurantiacus TaxID=446786 RepID=UPI0031D309C7
MERNSRRRNVTDRILVLVLVVVAASGVMSVLPATAQVAVGRLACRVGSLGLGACGADPIALTEPDLAPPRCAALAILDEALPEVRVSETTTATGLRLQTRTARSGDSVLHLGPDQTEEPPLLLAGQRRGRQEVLPGVVVTTSADWFLPGGQGGDVVVAAALEQHRQWLQRRSSLAPLGAVFGSSGRELPAPTLLRSRVWPAVAPLPTTPGVRTPVPDTTARVVLRPDQPAHLVTNTVDRDTVLTVGVTGSWAGQPVTGAASWRRAASGEVERVTVAVVAARALVKGEPAVSAGSAEVAYVTIPVSSPVERRLVESWLSRPTGFALPLPELLGLRQADVRDQLAGFLTRAATVTVLRYADTDRAELTRRVTEELISTERVERPGTRVTAAFTVAPQPNGAARSLTADPACATS